MIAIGITSSSEVSGTVTVSPHIDSLAFFQQVIPTPCDMLCRCLPSTLGTLQAIMPELQPAAAGAAHSPILVAAALKFIVAFRHTLGR